MRKIELAITGNFCLSMKVHLLCSYQSRNKLIQKKTLGATSTSHSGQKKSSLYVIDIGHTSLIWIFFRVLIINTLF